MAAMRVLVVDDNPDLVESLAMVLDFLGHEVRTALSGKDALTEMETWGPQLVLMDVGMPGMSGYDVAQQAREHAWGRATTLIAMTGWGRAEDRDRALAAGFDQHVVKPVDLERLRELLASLPAHS
ncbi:MAG: response regulator [Gemmatimonadaceae bacterium]